MRGSRTARRSGTALGVESEQGERELGGASGREAKNRKIKKRVSGTSKWRLPEGRHESPRKNLRAARAVKSRKEKARCST